MILEVFIKDNTLQAKIDDVITFKFSNLLYQLFVEEYDNFGKIIEQTFDSVFNNLLDVYPRVDILGITLKLNFNSNLNADFHKSFINAKYNLMDENSFMIIGVENDR